MATGTPGGGPSRQISPRFGHESGLKSRPSLLRPYNGRFCPDGRPARIHGGFDAAAGRQLGSPPFSLRLGHALTGADPRQRRNIPYMEVRLMRGHIRERGNRVFEINWEVSRDQHGRHRRSETVYGTEADAKKVLDARIVAVERQRDQARKAGPKQLLTGDWLYEWHRTVVMRGDKTTTQERYLSIIDRHLVPIVGDIPLVELAPRHVDGLHQTLLDLDLHPRTIGLFHSVLSGACKHALRLEIIHRNPAAAVPPPKAERKPISIPSTGAVLALLRLAEAEEHYLFLFLHILVYTGMRRGEAMALRWNNVYLKEGYVEVEGSVVKTHHQGLKLETPKTETSRRKIYLVGVTLELLALHQKSQEAECSEPAAENPIKRPGLVFPGKDGQWMKPSNMLRDLKDLARRAGIPDLTFHKLRHFHANTSLETSGNLFSTSRELGHSSITTTADMYGHPTERQQRAISRAFSQAMQDAASGTDPDEGAEDFPPDFPPDVDQIE